jgi:hypothetical protein
MTRASEHGRVTDLEREGISELGAQPGRPGRPWLQAPSDFVPLHVSRTPEDTMTATTDHYLSIDAHERKA